jgi:FkbM family methyltransferase
MSTASKHVELNGCANVEIIQAAVSDTGGIRAFDTRDSSYMGSIASSGNLHVASVALDDLVESGHTPPPTVVKIDIEGGEVGLTDELIAWHPAVAG